MSDTNKKQGSKIAKFLWQKIKESFFIVLIILSILFFILYFYLKFKIDNTLYQSNKELLDNLFTISNATLISGFVGAINQFLEYNKIYQKALENVLTSETYKDFIESNMVKFAYSKEILQNQKNLDEIWKTTTSTLLQAEFQNEVSRKFYDKIQETIFYKKNISHYHFDCKIFYNISIDDNDLLTIEQYGEHNVVRSKKDSFNYDFEFGLLNEEINQIEFKEVTICENDYNIGQNIKDSVVGDYKFKKFETELKNHESYDVTFHVILYQNYKTDKEFKYIFERFTENIYVEINNKSLDKLDIIFTSASTIEFKNIANFDGRKYTFRGILLPGLGFKMFFLKKG